MKRTSAGIRCVFVAMAMAQGALQSCSVAFGVSGGNFAGLASSGARISSVSFRGGAPVLSSPLTTVRRENLRRREGGRGGSVKVQREVAVSSVTIEAALGVEKKGVADSKVNGVPSAKHGAVGEAQVPSMEVDAVTEAELKENGFRSTRRTKLVCTIGPATCAPEQLEALAMGGMNVARLNMCHGTRDWHKQVIRNVRSLNSEKGYSVAIMMDTEGSEIHMGDFNGAPSVKAEVRDCSRILLVALKDLRSLLLRRSSLMLTSIKIHREVRNACNFLVDLIK